MIRAVQVPAQLPPQAFAEVVELEVVGPPPPAAGAGDKVAQLLATRDRLVRLSLGIVE